MLVVSQFDDFDWLNLVYLNSVELFFYKQYSKISDQFTLYRQQITQQLRYVPRFWFISNHDNRER